jgi:hypothetical protein
MRAVLAGVAVVALELAGGCLGGGGVVMLTVDQATNLTPPFSAFNASDGTANSDSLGVITFSATAPGQTFTMLVQGPIRAGQNVDLSVAHNVLSFDIKTGGWSSNGGMVAVDGVGPYRLRFLAVPMLPGAGSVTGSFVFDGSGSFK